MRDDNRRIVTAIVWRKINSTVADPLLNAPPPAKSGGGAKHVPFSSKLDISRFLNHPPNIGTPLEPEHTVEVFGPDGSSPTLTFKYDIRGAKRRKEWLILRQNQAETHPAWTPGGKLPITKSGILDYTLMILRLADGSFHARVANTEEISRMPHEIRQLLQSHEQGYKEL